MADINQTVKYLVELDGKISPSFKKMQKALDGFDKEVDKINKQTVSPKVDPKATKSINKFKGSLDGIMGQLSGSFPMLAELGTALTNPWVAASAAIAATATHLVGLANEIEIVDRQVRQFTDSVQETNKASDSVRALQKTFKDLDSKELTDAAKTLTKEFGISGPEAIAKIESALIATNGALDLDNIKEYSTQIKAFGGDADKLLSTLAVSSQEGFFQDKGIDTLKEFGLRIRELPKAAEDALKAVGVDVSQLEKDLNSGAKTQSQAFQEIFGDMSKFSTKQRQTLIADLLGGPGEDLGQRGIEALASQNKSLDELAKKNADIAKINQKNKELTEAQGGASRQLIPVIKKVEEIWANIQIAFYDLVAPIVDLSIEIGKLLADIFEMSGQGEMLGLIWANIVFQFKLAFEAVTAIVTAVRAFFRLMKDLRDKVLDSVQQKIVDIFGAERIEKWKNAFAEAINFIKELWDDFAGSISDFFEKLGNYADGNGFKLSGSSTPGSDKGESGAGSNTVGNTNGAGVDVSAENKKLMDNTIRSSVQSEVKSINIDIGSLQEIGVQNVTGQNSEEFRAQLQGALQAIIADTSQL